MALLSKDYGQAAEIRHVKRIEERLITRADELEAEGKLLSGWPRELWLHERIRPACEELWRRGRQLEQARAGGAWPGEGALRQASTDTAEPYLYWLRFRQALVPGTEPAVLAACVRAAGGGDLARSVVFARCRPACGSPVEAALHVGAACC